VIVLTDTEKSAVKRSRDKSLTFRVTEQEHDLIKKQMEKAGIKSQRAYLLKMALGGRIIHIELDSVREMVRLLSNATNNINQIARRVNQTGSVYAADINDLSERYESIWSQAKEILRRLSAM
jgi:hypothetical protein